MKTSRINFVGTAFTGGMAATFTPGLALRTESIIERYRKLDAVLKNL